MRFLGVRVDIEAAHKLKQELVSEEKAMLRKSVERNRYRSSNMGSKVH